MEGDSVGENGGRSCGCLPRVGGEGAGWGRGLVEENSDLSSSRIWQYSLPPPPPFPYTFISLSLAFSVFPHSQHPSRSSCPRAAAVVPGTGPKAVSLSWGVRVQIAVKGGLWEGERERGREGGGRREWGV